MLGTIKRVESKPSKQSDTLTLEEWFVFDDGEKQSVLGLLAGIVTALIVEVLVILLEVKAKVWHYAGIMKWT